MRPVTRDAAQEASVNDSPWYGTRSRLRTLRSGVFDSGSCEKGLTWNGFGLTWW